MRWLPKFFPMEYDLSEKRVALLMGERLGRAVMNGTVKGLFFTPMLLYWAPVVAETNWGETGSFLVTTLFSICYLCMFFGWFNNRPFGYDELSPPVRGMPLKIFRQVKP